MLIMPSIVIFIVCYIFPIGYMMYLSFFKWDMLTEMNFVGIKNFADLLTKEEFHRVLKNTFISAIIKAMICRSKSLCR